MNILKLTINDLKKITAVEIDPETGIPVILTGDNGNGKSSVLDSIILALSNAGMADPIRHGRPSGSVKLTLGSEKAEYLLERKVTKSGDKLTLTTAEGTPVQKPQTFLNGLLGNYAFDPLEFTRLKPKEQTDALKVAAGLDFTAIDALRAEHYAARTDVARAGKEAAAQLASIPEPSKDTPDEEVSAAKLMEEHSALIAKRHAFEKATKDTKATAASLDACENKIKELKDQLAKAESEMKSASKHHEESRNDLITAANNNPADKDIDVAVDAIHQVDKTNAEIRQTKNWKNATERVNKLRLDHANLSRRIEEIDEEKTTAIRNANLPLDGLELTEDGVMVNGVFFTQLSTAEQIRVSTLVAMSQNPELKIIIIREGALINTSNLSLIADLAKERGFQVWIEKFQETPSDIGFHIIAGAIAFENGKEVA